jgi:hypothetical protein
MRGSRRSGMKKIIILIAAASILLGSAGFSGAEQSNSRIKPQASPKCEIVPKQGNCKAYFRVYYFNSKTNRCEELRGCYDSVFDTMEECKKLCWDNSQTKSVSGKLERIKNNPVPDGNDYRMKLDEPIVFAKGSKSERSTDIVTLILPLKFKKKATELEGKHVSAIGSLDCTMHYSPWTATCNMVVEKMDLQD